MAKKKVQKEIGLDAVLSQHAARADKCVLTVSALDDRVRSLELTVARLDALVHNLGSEVEERWTIIEEGSSDGQA